MNPKYRFNIDTTVADHELSEEALNFVVGGADGDYPNLGGPRPPEKQLKIVVDENTTDPLRGIDDDD